MKTNKTSVRATKAGNVLPRPRLSALVIGAALAQLSIGVVHADSAVGVDVMLGNVLNPSSVDPVSRDAVRHPDNKGTYDPPARTPTGKLHGNPWLAPQDVSVTEGGWAYFGFVEAGFGVTGGKDNAHGWRRYKDLDNGFYLSTFSVNAERKDTAHYVELFGGSVGRDDQFYFMRTGRYNDWRLQATYSETPHVFTTTYRPIWDGIGTGYLKLKPGLVPGGTADNAVNNQNIHDVAMANAGTEISLIRQKTALRLDKTLTDNWKFFAGYSYENREGARPFGSVWGGGGGNSSTELVESIDYGTHDMFAGMYYADQLTNFNMQASVSLFRNEIDTMKFENPHRTAAANGLPAGAFTTGQFDLYPDNDAYNVKAEYARRLPDFMNGRVTALVSLGSTRQNDNLHPYTTLPGVEFANVIGNNWDSVDSLSKPRAGARMDTRLFDLGLTLNPTDALSVRAKARHYQTINKTEYLACNPNASYADIDPFVDGAQPGVLTAYGCSGVWGRVLNDGSGASVVMAANAAYAGNLILRNIPFDHKRTQLSLTGDYRLGKATTLSAMYERDIYQRDHRERTRTWEDKIKLGYVNRGMENSTLRLSYEHTDRRGTEYHTHHPYSDFLSGYFLPMPTTEGSAVTGWVVHMNDQLRKFDLADREQNIVNARWNYMAREDLDFGISAQFKDIKFPNSSYGRRNQRSHTVNFDVDYQPSVNTNVFGYVTFQGGRIAQRGVPSGGGVACSIGVETPLGVITPETAEHLCPNPDAGVSFVAANMFDTTYRDQGNTVGLGFRHDFGKARLDMNFSHSRVTTKVGYTIPANATDAVKAAAGTGFPDLNTVSNALEANLWVPINKTMTTRFVLRHEQGRISDWHYEGFQDSPVAVNQPGTALPTGVVLDAGPQSYKANFVGVMLRVGF